jgi:hypothetical protein
MTNVDSRPEEVMAGILFMMEGYGLLCAEDLAIFQ